MYSVISVIVDLLPGNTKNRESTRSWTARVRLVHPWAAWVRHLAVTHEFSRSHSWAITAREFMNKKSMSHHDWENLRVIMSHSWILRLHSRRRSDLKFLGQDLSVFLIDLLSDGDSVYSRENSFEIWGTPVKTCLIWMGTPVKTCWVFCQS